MPIEHTESPLILIVDDVEEDRVYMGRMLEAAGYSVCVADTAESGLRMARQRHPALVVMDVKLPGISGLEATRRLKSDPLTARTPVVVVTGYAMERRKANDAHYDALLNKPLAEDVLCDTVARLLEAAAFTR